MAAPRNGSAPLLQVEVGLGGGSGGGSRGGGAGAVGAVAARENALRRLASTAAVVDHVCAAVATAAEEARERLKRAEARCTAAAARLDALERGGARAATLIESSAKYPKMTASDGTDAALLRPLFDATRADIARADATLSGICGALDAARQRRYTAAARGDEAGVTHDESTSVNESAPFGSGVSWRGEAGGALEILRFGMSESVNVKNKSLDSIQGLGEPPASLQSVADLLLFNTNTNVYRKHDTALDALGDGGDDDDFDGSARRGVATGDDDMASLSDAPTSVMEGDTLPIVGINEIGFRPTLGPVPELSLPSELPELSRAANDISWTGGDDVGDIANIAPSAMAEALPDLDFGPTPGVGATDTAGAGSGQGGTGDQSGMPPPVPPPPPTEAGALPPPPPPPPPSAAPDSSTPPPPVVDTGRSALLEQIRNPGAVLRKVKRDDDAHEDDTASPPRTAAAPAGPPTDPHSALMAAVLSRKKPSPGAADGGGGGNASMASAAAADTNGDTQIQKKEQPTAAAPPRRAPVSDPHGDLMSAIKNRASISLKPPDETSERQRRASAPEPKGDIMSQLADDLKKRRISIAVRLIHTHTPFSPLDACCVATNILFVLMIMCSLT